jgi:hypothetical protein
MVNRDRNRDRMTKRYHQGRPASLLGKNFKVPKMADAPFSKTRM